MSGGVDSSVSALLLKNQGYEVVGIYFILNDEKNDFVNVKKIAKKIGVEVFFENLSEMFRKKIINYLIKEYQANRTPNPCVKCNREIKFNLLKKFAKKYGCEKIATGHYARIRKKILNGKNSFSLIKGVDETKDQTYYLYRLNQDDLKLVVFPLGKLKKSEVKKIAKEQKIMINIKESQDICFLSDNEKIRDFLKKNINLRKKIKGKIVNEIGEKLGEHQGLSYYTIGQRKGLGLSGGPYFVIEKIKKENKLVVSKEKNHPKLFFKKIKFKNVSWVGLPPKKNKKYLIKTRYQSQGVLGKIQKRGDFWYADLEKAQWASAPGQSLVVYDGQVLIGGGIIF